MGLGTKSELLKTRRAPGGVREAWRGGCPCEREEGGPPGGRGARAGAGDPWGLLRTRSPANPLVQVAFAAHQADSSVPGLRSGAEGGGLGLSVGGRVQVLRWADGAGVGRGVRNDMRALH